MVISINVNNALSLIQTNIGQKTLKGLESMTNEELNSLREKDITQWLIKHGEQKMLEGQGHTTPLVALSLREFLNVDLAAVAEVKRHWHTTKTTTSH